MLCTFASTIATILAHFAIVSSPRCLQIGARAHHARGMQCRSDAERHAEERAEERAEECRALAQCSAFCRGPARVLLDMGELAARLYQSSLDKMTPWE